MHMNTQAVRATPWPVVFWWLMALVSWAFLPWYWQGEVSAFSLSLSSDRLWLLPPASVLVIVAIGFGMRQGSVLRAWCWTLGSGWGLLWVLLQGFAIGLKDVNWPIWASALSMGNAQALALMQAGQAGLGWGGLLLSLCLLVLLSQGVAALGKFRGDGFLAGTVWGVGGLVLLFVFYPVLRSLLRAFTDESGAWDAGLALARLGAPDIWGLGCLGQGTGCGVAWNSLFLATSTGIISTLLGLSFALLALRSGFRFQKSLKVLSILPIITPPFVIALVLVVLFGRSGMVTGWLDVWFGIEPSRWIYGYWGVLMAQVLSQTPLSFLILLGVIQGISPTLEEASQTLRASHWHSFKTVTWPLMRPGITSTFLLGFVESLSDFGNPLVLGGNFEVLSTKIFFAIAGAQNDPGRAAILALILLVMTLGAFWLQYRWLGKTSFVTVTGKGDAGLPTPLPRRVRWLCHATALPWALFTAVLYGLILVGGFVVDIGRADFSPTLAHFGTGFGVEWGQFGLQWTGSAWDSFFITTMVAAVAAPLTTVVGILTAYVLARQDFAGRRSFEFLTMLSFAIPGTVIGIAYIVAFNVPPFELTGTGLILVICFVFRNMPVGVRAGLAALSQIDKSLDEASATLRASTAYTLQRVILPLIKPAITATLVFSFVQAMTAVSAVIFLVTAKYNMATAYIAGRVEAGEYALAIAYCTFLIAFMLLVIVLIQGLVGERQLGRRSDRRSESMLTPNVLPGVH